MSLLPSSCAETFRDVDTCLNAMVFFFVVHPSTTIHTQLNDDEKIATGITPDLVRVSVGIEHIDDIIADFDKAISSIDF
ncbi:Protein MET17 [Smittium culicis]|uniref:Protein MET17 n=1 Tax=Smittium culicis TaxID=133412 RepID=A0A1R1YQ42_9FUNG|nr:Protein MET17 [Smittium culicis]